jgi:hypothetical protein
MKLTLIRKEFTEVSTIGDMLIDNEYFCHTLEDRDMQRLDDGSIIPWSGELKIPGATAIPYGSYNVITNYSNRFKRVMPLLLNVPGFEGVRIHSGNTDKDVAGCIAVGFKKDVDFVGQSKLAFEAFFQRLEKGLKQGKVRIEIKVG